MTRLLGLHTAVLCDFRCTYADDVHESVHAVADLEEEVLTLPLGRRAEGRPDEPGDAGDEEKGTQDDGRDLHLFNHRQGNGLPLKNRQGQNPRTVPQFNQVLVRPPQSQSNMMASAVRSSHVVNPIGF